MICVSCGLLGFLTLSPLSVKSGQPQTDTIFPSELRALIAREDSFGLESTLSGRTSVHLFK